MTTPLAELKQAALTNALRSCQIFAGISTPELNAIAEITTVKSVKGKTITVLDPSGLAALLRRHLGE